MFRFFKKKPPVHNQIAELLLMIDNVLTVNAEQQKIIEGYELMNRGYAGMIGNFERRHQVSEDRLKIYQKSVNAFASEHGFRPLRDDEVVIGGNKKSSAYLRDGVLVIEMAGKETRLRVGRSTCWCGATCRPK